MQFNKIEIEITALTRTNKEEYYQNYFNKHNANLKKNMEWYKRNNQY